MRSDAPIRYSIVVPFYNEQENIPTLYMKITEVMDSIGEPYEMVFVDDGSKDNSYRVLSEIYEHDRRVNVVRLRMNFGQTPALKAGFDFARGEVVISMDGDLQHDPEEIPRFLEKIEEGYDLVSGWRAQRKDHWLMRRLPSRVANWMMAKLSGIDLHDFGTTFKAYRREILQEIQLYGELHRFIPALASSTGAGGNGNRSHPGQHAGSTETAVAHRCDRRARPAAVAGRGVVSERHSADFDRVARRNHFADVLRIAEQGDLRAARGQEPPERAGRFGRTGATEREFGAVGGF